MPKNSYRQLRHSFPRNISSHRGTQVRLVLYQENLGRNYTPTYGKILWLILLYRQRNRQRTLTFSIQSVYNPLNSPYSFLNIHIGSANLEVSLSSIPGSAGLTESSIPIAPSNLQSCFCFIYSTIGSHIFTYECSERS